MDFMQLLADMQSEVGEFHPFLNQLFKKLPSIAHVHYTHGPDEMGADFVLYREDPALEQRDVVGVIAKLGSIKMDHSDVVRQIDECMVTRPAPDGRESLQINEVWVAASGGITENAKRKIIDRFRGRKVTFLKNEKLASLADKHLQYYGASMPVAYAEYKEKLLAVLRDLDNKSALIPGMEIPFQCPDVQELKPDTNGLFKVMKGFSSLDALHEDLRGRSFTMLEAGMGGGKSRLVRELIRHALELPDYGAGKHIPIFVTCTELQGKYEYDLDKLVADKAENLSGDLLPSWLIAVDGFDELREEMDRKLELIKGFSTWAHAKSGRSVLLTSRPSDKLQASWAANGSAPTLMRVKPLRGKKALALFTAVGGNADLSTKIQKDLANSPLLKSLDASPISYTLLARIVKENDQEIPASVPELFNKYFELVLGRWEIDKGLRKQVEYSVMHACLAELSVSLMDNNRGEMPVSEAARIISEYTSKRGINMDVPQFIGALSERSHVLYVDQQNETLGFRHRGFCEFFYAFKLHRAATVDISRDVFHPYWIGTYYFLAGLLKDCPDLIGSLSGLRLETEMHRLMRIVNLGHILQAGYMTPQADVSSAVKQVCFDAADLYQFVRSDSQSTLGKLTTMQLLGLIRSVMVDVYGYKRFEKALSDTVCDIASSAYSEKNALALLFASLAHNEADGRVDFDGLIGAYGDALPIEVKVMIRGESQKISEISDRLKKFNRNLKKSIQANAKGGQVPQIRRLFDSPIRALPGANESNAKGGKKKA